MKGAFSYMYFATLLHFVLVMCEPGWLCGVYGCDHAVLFFSSMLLVVCSVSMDSVGIHVQGLEPRTRDTEM
jgi:hypothetical protein